MNESAAKENDNTHKKYYKDTFKISAKKRQRRIIKMAAQEFSETQGHLNVIAGMTGRSCIHYSIEGTPFPHRRR